MYEIRPESVKTFLNDRNIKLPRFQRKQTWDEKKNFQLCISLFKEYPIGVSILSVDSNKDKTIRWLLDGRQRKNALIQIYEDPENIYNWSKKFIGFKNSDQPDVLEEKFWKKINDYIEIDPNENNEQEEITTIEDVDNTEGTEYTNYNEKDDYNKTGLNLLLEIIKLIHNKQVKNSGFTKPFDFTKVANKIPYLENTEGNIKLSSKKIRTLIDEYRRFCDDENLNYEQSESFYKYMVNRCVIIDDKKFSVTLKSNWDSILERIQIIDRIDNILLTCKIGIIEVKNLTASDAQKIFNIINSEGEKLTAVEVLSAKPNWNATIENPSEVMISSVAKLYKRIGTLNTDIVKWDLPATLVRRIGKNYVLKIFTDSKSDFEKEITIGFKILAGIYQKGVKKEDIDNLSKNGNINWNTDFEKIVLELQQVVRIISNLDYFKYFNSWKTTLMDITSDSIALNFLISIYKDWKKKGEPLGNDIRVKQLQKNAFILWDKTIYEYVNKQWRGSSDSKIASNLNSLESEGTVFQPLPKEKWETLLKEIFISSSIDGSPITLSLMKPLLYHFYSLKYVQGPDSDNEIEIDHIIPQYLFEQSTFDDKNMIKDNLLNLGLLPKNENISKGKKRLIELTQEWMKDQVVKYEFIDKNDFEKYSDINNLKSIYKEREQLFYYVFLNKRETILNN